MTERTETTPEDDPYNELLWGGDFDDRQEAELERKNRCPKCGEPHPADVIRMTKLLGASVVLCRKCTAIEKARLGVSNEP